MGYVNEFDVMFDDVTIMGKVVTVHNLRINGLDFNDYFIDTSILDSKVLGIDEKLYNLVKDVIRHELSDDELFKLIQTQIQNSLDIIARQKNYDNSFMLASYAESTIPRFRNEALKFIEFRDQCWSICYDLLNKYTSGEIERPTLENVLGSLPVFEW